MRKTALLVVFLTVFIDLLGFGMVLPLLPLYGKELAGEMTPMQRGILLGLLMSSFSVMQFFFAPVWGRLSDKVGRRPILMVGLAGSVVFYGLFGVASAQASLLLLFISRIGAGVFGATITTARAYIADVTPPEKRTAGMALIGAAFGLGFTFGPLFGLLAIDESKITIAVEPDSRFVLQLPANGASEINDGETLTFNHSGEDEVTRVGNGFKLVLEFDKGTGVTGTHVAVDVVEGDSFIQVANKLVNAIKNDNSKARLELGLDANVLSDDKVQVSAVKGTTLTISTGVISPWPGYGAAILSLLALLLAWFRLPESLKPDSLAARSKVIDLVAWRKALAIPSIGLLLLTSFLYVFCFATLEVILSLFLKEHYKFETKDLLLVFTYIGLVLFFVQMGFVRQVSKRVSEGALSIGGSLVMVGGFLLLALLHDSEWHPQVVLFGGLAVVVCGFSCMRPAINSLISRRTDPAQQGTVMGVTDSVQSLSRIVGPLVGLPLYHAIVVGPLYLGAILMVVGILLLKVAVGRGKDFEPVRQEEKAGQVSATGE
jgi:MFS family permease